MTTKTITIKTLRFVESSFNGTIKHHMINISDKHPTHYYDFRVTDECLMHMKSIWKDAGYEIKFEKLEGD
jgi:hypothetical protein